MQIGNDTIEFVWPGFSAAFPGIVLFLVLPAVLLFALIRYTRIRASLKFVLSPLAILLPITVCALLPAVVALCPYFRVYSAGEARKMYYSEAANLFGVNSIHVYGAVASIVVIYIAYYTRMRFLEATDKEEMR